MGALRTQGTHKGVFIMKPNNGLSPSLEQSFGEMVMYARNAAVKDPFFTLSSTCFILKSSVMVVS